MSRSTRNARARSARNGDPVPAGSSTVASPSPAGPFQSKRARIAQARQELNRARAHWQDRCATLKDTSPMAEEYVALLDQTEKASEAYVNASQAFLRACEKV